MRLNNEGIFLRRLHASGAACSQTGWVVDGCIADVTGDVILIIDDIFEKSFSWTFYEGTDGCGCG